LSEVEVDEQAKKRDSKLVNNIKRIIVGIDNFFMRLTPNYWN